MKPEKSYSFALTDDQYTDRKSVEKTGVSTSHNLQWGCNRNLIRRSSQTLFETVVALCLSVSHYKSPCLIIIPRLWLSMHENIKTERAY